MARNQIVNPFLENVAISSYLKLLLFSVFSWKWLDRAIERKRSFCTYFLCYITICSERMDLVLLLFLICLTLIMFILVSMKKCCSNYCFRPQIFLSISRYIRHTSTFHHVSGYRINPDTSVHCLVTNYVLVYIERHS